MKILAVLAIIAIAVLEALAMAKGINGAYLSLAIMAISGLGGYTIGSLRAKHGGGRPW